MRRYLNVILSMLIFVSVPFAGSQTQAAPAHKEPGLLERLLKFLGVSDVPSTLKAPDMVKSGEIWIADLRTGTTRRLTIGDNFRSPVFLSWSGDLVALKGTELVQISVSDGEQRTLYSEPSIAKLIGSSMEGDHAVLVLIHSDGAEYPQLGILGMESGKIAALSYDVTSQQDLQVVEALQESSRKYKDRQLDLGNQIKGSLTGKIEWQDVFLQIKDQVPIDISRCDGLNCGQPSMSSDGFLVAFVRAGPSIEPPD